jgi:hypothetical protein
MLTQAMRQDILKMFDSGIAPAEVAVHLGLAHSTVLAVLVDRNPGLLSDAEDVARGDYSNEVTNTVKGLYTKGKGIAYIAKSLNIEVDDVLIILAREGVPPTGIVSRSEKFARSERLSDEVLAIYEKNLDSDGLLRQGVWASTIAEQVGCSAKQVCTILLSNGYSLERNRRVMPHPELEWRE